ncbi:MAG: methyltransferase [Dehalococcoidia bacterium]|jgi:16S rRNA (guanine1207-N2)-methyltransferase
MDEDVYLLKTIAYRAYGHAFRFRTSQELFSSHDIDTGTRFLLRTLVENGLEQSSLILDLGCGYGPLGLIMKKLNPLAGVHLVDRDALAVSYARQNAELNDLVVPDIYGSLGYDDVRRNDFDLIVSNIPGKAGESVITCLVREAKYYLAPGGTAAVVVVGPLEAAVAAILESTPGAEIILRRKRSGHTVFHYRFNGNYREEKPSGTGLERGIYHRDRVNIEINAVNYTIQTARGLPEFDSLNYKTGMLLQSLSTIGLPADTGTGLVLNPGQGHVPVTLWKKVRPREILLADRDLLALRYSRNNLLLNGCPSEQVNIRHCAGIDPEPGVDIDLAIGVLREEEGRRANYLTVMNAAAGLSPRRMMVLAAGSTAITRLVADLGEQPALRIVKREKRKGNGLLVLQPFGV